jgi:hypothetical protein
MRSPYCLFLCAYVSLWIPVINFWLSPLIFMKFGVYVMAPEPNSTACLINPSYQSMCLYVYPLCRYQETAQKSVSLLSFLGNSSVNTFPAANNTRNNRRIVSLGLSVCPLLLVGKTRWRNSRDKEELLEALFFMRFVSYKRKVGH